MSETIGENKEEVSEEYRESIKWLAKNRINEVFYNSDERHAVVIFSEMIKNSENYVYVVCKNMNKKVTCDDEYCDAVRKFLSNDKRHEMKILITDYKESFEKSKIANVFRNYTDQVEIKYFEPRAKIFIEDSPVNWAVADDRAFRFEENEDDCVAIGNFNNPFMAGKLKESFNTFFNDNTKKVQL